MPLPFPFDCVCQGTGISFAFIARNKLAILESAPNGSCLRLLTAPSVSSNSSNAAADAGRIEPLPILTDRIFSAGPNRLLLLADDKVGFWGLELPVWGSGRVRSKSPSKADSFKQGTVSVRRGIACLSCSARASKWPLWPMQQFDAAAGLCGKTRHEQHQ